MKNLLLGLLLSLTFAAAQQSACGASREANSQGRPGAANRQESPTPSPSPSEVGQAGGFRILAEGQHGKADQAFVAVVRDAESYGKLRELAGELPEVSAELFEASAVVAAFLGQRNTGGYSVSVTPSGGNVLRIAEKRPPQGAMSAQVITNPFVVVSVSEGDGAALLLEVDDNWKRRLTSYKVAEGEFTMSGGIMGRVEKFKLAGDAQTTGLGSLITVFLNVNAVGASKQRALLTVMTGSVGSSSEWVVPRLHAGTLVDPPNEGLKATVRLLMKNQRLEITFEPRHGQIADGFIGEGKITCATAGVNN